MRVKEYEILSRYKLLAIHSSTSVMVLTDSNTISAYVSTVGLLDTLNSVAFPFSACSKMGFIYIQIKSSEIENKNRNIQNDRLTRITSSSLLSSPAKTTLIFFFGHASPNTSFRINFAAAPEAYEFAKMY